MPSLRLLGTAFVTWTLVLLTSHGAHARDDVHIAEWSPNNASMALSGQLLPRQLPKGECNKDTPCVIEACCNGEYCGFGDAYCGKDVCVSQCDAKAECGQYAKVPGATCPLNVCCGATGACGTTVEFCDPQSVDPKSGPCQSNCEQPGPGNPSPGDVHKTVIGYFESWSLLRRGCANREISSIRYDSLTHINVAFGYIKPDTYDIHPIPGASIAGFKAITDLKQHAPNLKVWLSLGGWSFSDNDTDTQPVFGDLSSTVDKRFRFFTKLENFMLEWGFDGVDIDWEYPTATDRRGKPQDTENYVSLLREMRDFFRTSHRGWGISFAAPASYWYLRHFNIGEMIKYVDWVNLMTYDLHGSWDQDSHYIGAHVFAHTNLTEIKDALNLLWRNNVPASQVNLGLGFYGRSYTLKDPNCWQPGCVFESAGIAGTCSGTAGYMSYQDIEYHLEDGTGTVHYDEEAAVQYLTYGDNQWVSYDSVNTIKQKVEFANSQGLNGLFIWAIDQDTLDNKLLDAVLYPDGLGKFKEQNGAGNDGSEWESQPLTYCQWSDCGGDCSGPFRGTTKVRCSEPGKYQTLCCPFSDVPDTDFCKWRPPSTNFLGLCSKTVGCGPGEVALASNDHYVDPKTGKDEVCSFGGTAYYCCQAEETGDNLCQWAGKCVELDHTPKGTPKSEVCPSGSRTVTYRKGGCGGSWDQNSWEPFCCSEKVKDPKCYWEAKSGWEGISFSTCGWTCKDGEIDLGYHDWGGGESCPAYWSDGESTYSEDGARKLCCDRNALSVKIRTVPVDITHLWENVGDRVDKDKQTWALSVDDNKSPLEADFSLNPDEHAFGWHIFSGPEDKVTTLDKRSGSDWELFDCDTTKHEGRQSAKMVCMSDGEDHNCGTIWKGQVERTIIEMPSNCGVGKYAMAVSLEEIGSARDYLHLHKLVKRAPQGATVYNLTFDYNFHVLQGRADAEDVLIRIDYSNDKGYWHDMVAAAPGDPLRKRDDYDEVAAIVKRDHGGDWKRYLDHEWRTERRNTPDDRLHELHKKWFSQELEDWINRQRKISYETTVLSHGIHDQYIIDLINVKNECPLEWLPAGVEDDIGAVISATLDLDVQTSALLTMKGDMAHIGDIQSYLTFRNKGEIKASLTFDAWAELKFPSWEKTLFGIAPLGLSFKVPGVVTVGPEFKVNAAIEGQMGIHADARIDFHVVSWDYAQTFPYQGDEPIDESNEKKAEASTNKGPVSFSWEVDVNGEITAHIIPTMTFGVVFNPSFELPNAAVDLALDSWAQLYGSASAGTSTGGSVQWCYGADAGYNLFAQVTAPRLFGVNLNRRWSLAGDTVSHPVPLYTKFTADGSEFEANDRFTGTQRNIFGDSSGDKTCGVGAS